MEFPNGAHDDMVDAMVYAIRMLLVDGQKLVSAEDFELSGEFDEEFETP